jgi:hypothetical protein
MARLRQALCLVLSLGGGACASSPSIEPPEVSLVGLTLGRSGLLEQRLWVDLRLSNPNAFEVGWGRRRREVDLPAGGEVVVPVLMTITTHDLIATMMDLSSDQQLPYHLTGEAELEHVSMQTVPFEWRGRLELPSIAAAETAES